MRIYLSRERIETDRVNLHKCRWSFFPHHASSSHLYIQNTIISQNINIYCVFFYYANKYYVLLTFPPWTYDQNSWLVLSDRHHEESDNNDLRSQYDHPIQTDWATPPHWIRCKKSAIHFQCPLKPPWDLIDAKVHLVQQCLLYHRWPLWFLVLKPF